MKTGKEIGLRANTKPQAVILAGGRSSRFGEDKARSRCGRETLLQRVAQSLEEAGFQITLSTGYKEHEMFGYPIIWDKELFYGPLYALGNILEAIDHQKIFLTACDTPWIKPLLVRWLWEKSENADIVLLENESGNPSPLPGIYSKKILPVVRENIAAKEKSLKSLLKRKLRINTLPVRDWHSIDPQGKSLVNINTKQDLKKIFIS